MDNKRLITLVLGVVFVLAGSYRIIFSANATQEMIDLGLPTFLSYLLIPFELIIGTLFLTNTHVKQTSIATLVFLGFALLWGVAVNPSAIINTHELYVFNTTPTDLLLHAMYFLLAFLVFRSK
ncbi:MAG: hypothetical protein GOU98_00010 [Candidatus Altiarchaeota archaeon]|nr:hypothetical protein [Candidatus Altiarchaeota archaeon]